METTTPPRGAADFIAAAVIVWPVAIILGIWGIILEADAAPYGASNHQVLFVFAGLAALGAMFATTVGAYRLALHADRAAGVPPRQAPPVPSKY